MIIDESPVLQAFLATLFTWFVTAVGSSMVFFIKGYKQKTLHASLGFAAGVMTAASVWSLLLPAIEIAELNYGSKKISCLPVTIGFLIGAFFVYITDQLLPENVVSEIIQTNIDEPEPTKASFENSDSKTASYNTNTQSKKNLIRNRNAQSMNYNEISIETGEDIDEKKMAISKSKKDKFRKILLLIIAVTVHNIPEGLAVGVGFGAIGKSTSSTFTSARNLAFGIGLQNFPEGLAVSLPLYASGFSYWKSFWYGQLSGMVEPIAGIIGALTVNVSQSILPYALSFAAGAMIYVVVDNLIPEATSGTSNKLSSWSFIFGFCLMMCLDVGLG